MGGANLPIVFRVRFFAFPSQHDRSRDHDDRGDGDDGNDQGIVQNEPRLFSRAKKSLAAADPPKAKTDCSALDMSEPARAARKPAKGQVGIY